MNNLIDQSMKLTISHDESKDGKFSFNMANVKKGTSEAQMVAAAKAVDSLIDANGLIDITLTQKYSLNLEEPAA